MPDISEVRDALPFQMVAPGDLPYDIELDKVIVTLPPDRMDDAARERATSATLLYGNPEGTAGFQLEEKIVAMSLGSPDKEELSIDGNDVEFLVSENNSDEEAMGAAWGVCDIGLSLTTTTSGELSRDDVLDIVGSTFSCPRVSG